jgi:TIR domain
MAKIMTEKTVEGQFVDFYRGLVATKYPDMIGYWPSLGRHNYYRYFENDIYICVLEDTGHVAFSSSGPIPPDIAKHIAGKMQTGGRARTREFLRKSMNLNTRSTILILRASQNGDLLTYNTAEFEQEAENAMVEHETTLGLSNNKIFLSHKGVDKSLVRDFKQTLDFLGYETWLDEDAMPAGTALEKGILTGFKDSCAVVFFITPNFRDEGYLESEIQYAIQQKREKGDKFQIITLVFNASKGEISIPDLLKTYVYKHPTNLLEALREIFRALPLKTGNVIWK